MHFQGLISIYDQKAEKILDLLFARTWISVIFKLGGSVNVSI